MNRFVFLLILLSGSVCSTSAWAVPNISTIYLNNGGMVRGEIVIDIPGAPLTVMVAGQSMQLPRADILRIETADAPLDPGATAAPAVDAVPAGAIPALESAPAAPVVTAAPVVVPSPPSAPIALAPTPEPVVAPARTAPVTLLVDRHGRALLDGSWSPEVQQLVAQRNDLVLSVRRKKIGGPVAMLALGIAAFIGTAIGVNETNKAFQKCAVNADYLSECDADTPVALAIAGYTVSSAMIVIGGTLVLVRLIKRKRLKLQLAGVDQQLRERGIVPVAQLRLKVSGGMAGIALSQHF